MSGSDSPGDDDMTSLAPLHDGHGPGPDAVAAALDESIARLASGEGLEAVVARYPDLEVELRPLLEAVAIMRAVVPPPAPPDVRARVRERVMVAAQAALGPAPAGRPSATGPALAGTNPWWHWPWLHLQPATLVGTAVALTVLFSGTGGALVASADALPGQPLYSVKLVVEDTRVAFAQATSGPEVLVALQTELCNRRLQEAQVLLELGQPVPAEVIVAATQRLAAAEAVVARASGSRRAQLEAVVTQTQSRTEAVLAHVLENVPPQSQEQIERLLAARREAVRAGQPGRDATPEPATPTASGTPSQTSTPSPTTTPSGPATPAQTPQPAVGTSVGTPVGTADTAVPAGTAATWGASQQPPATQPGPSGRQATPSRPPTQSGAGRPTGQQSGTASLTVAPGAEAPSSTPLPSETRPAGTRPATSEATPAPAEARATDRGPGRPLGPVASQSPTATPTPTSAPAALTSQSPASDRRAQVSDAATGAGRAAALPITPEADGPDDRRPGRGRPDGDGGGGANQRNSAAGGRARD